MKCYSKLLLANISISLILLSSCHKEIKEVNINEEVQTASANNDGNPDPGFVDNNMVMYWNEKAATVLNIHTNPGSDSRSFAIIEIAVHDALNNIKPKYERYAFNQRDHLADPNAAIASAAYWSIKGLNKQGSFPVDLWYNESLGKIPNGQSKELGIVLGKASAESIIANRANDGISQVILRSLFPPDGDEPGEFRSVLPESNPALNLPHFKYVPNWGTVMRPFVTQNNYQFRPAGPYPVNSAAYTADYNEVKSKGALTGSTRTADEETLSRFWSDVRHHIVWNDFTRAIIATKNIDAWKTARLFALIHTAMADGASAMFEAKYHFYYWRPETAIRIADDGNPDTVSDSTWLPNVIGTPQANPAMNIYTPRVPEYPSGPGILGGITGQVLQSFFGTDIISVDITSLKLPGVILHYNSIAKAVSDNSISKIFTGWYFRKAAIDGEEQGRQIGNYVLNNHFRPIDE
jgi:hypothetical protein